MIRAGHPPSISAATPNHEPGDLDRAIADFSEAIRVNDKDALAFYHRALVYRDKRDFDRAIADFGQAIKLNPKQATVYDARGLAYRLKGDLARAIADFTGNAPAGNK